MAKTEKKATIEVVCVQNFRDKHTNKIHKKGETFKVTEERLAEILKVGEFVKKYEAPKAEGK